MSRIRREAGVWRRGLQTFVARPEVDKVAEQLGLSVENEARGWVRRQILVTHLGQDRVVELSAGRHFLQGLGAQDEWGGAAGEGGLTIQLCRQGTPVLQADLEDLHLLHFRDQDQVVQGLWERCSTFIAHIIPTKLTSRFALVIYPLITACIITGYNTKDDQ